MGWVGFPDGLQYDRKKMLRWFKKISADDSARHFVVDRDGDICGEEFYRIDRTHGRAGLDIKLFTRYNGKGVACPALTQLINLCFEQEADMDEVWTEPAEGNIAAKMYRKCGLAPKARPADLNADTNSYWALEGKRRGSRG